MTTDDGAAYTIFPCNNCVSVNMIDSVQPNGCTALGLKMVIPRTQAHWSSLISFVSTVLGSSLATYFKTVPGIYKPTDGLTPCNGGYPGSMNFASCVGVNNSWRAIDGGQWWLRENSLTYNQVGQVLISFPYSSTLNFLFSARWQLSSQLPPCTFYEDEPRCHRHHRLKPDV